MAKGEEQSQAKIAKKAFGYQLPHEHSQRPTTLQSEKFFLGASEGTVQEERECFIMLICGLRLKNR